VSEYNVVGLYSEENYGEDATCLMDIANISSFNSKGPEYNNTPYWESIDTASDRPPNDYHSDTDAEEKAVLQKLFTKEGAEMLIEALADDYDTFHFPKNPDWLAGATGEWFDAVLSEAQAGPPPLAFKKKKWDFKHYHLGMVVDIYPLLKVRFLLEQQT